MGKNGAKGVSVGDFAQPGPISKIRFRRTEPVMRAQVVRLRWKTTIRAPLVAWRALAL
ncbi:hypothetical protein FTUN_5894 [Frigoriglobus tundricola]|uniref:Uncharacterized protein n=1 Tax=Frigoriglobus tundricola TaxID=2774151 RepID=A0A6M5YY13_9BACT|nr:hypothetical protein FTUN_5894 [Frigoriglobus tundricola]